MKADAITATRGQPIVETAHVAHVSIEDGIATIKVRRTFHNKGAVAEQIEMRLDLPRNSVATGLRIKGKTQWYDGMLMETEMANIVYESLTGYGPWRLKDPALLSWNRPGMLDLLIFPIKPGESNTIEYTLIQPLIYRKGKQYFFYGRGRNHDNMAIPKMIVHRVEAGKSVVVNGLRISLGKSISLSNGAVIIPHCDDETDAIENEYDGMDDNWYEPVCPTETESLIEAIAPKINTVAHRLGVFQLGEGDAVLRLEIDAAPLLRKSPQNASVVFVVDVSHSVGDNAILAATEFCRAFAKNLADARFEIVTFSRHSHRAFGKFVGYRQLEAAIDAAAANKLFVPKNGSNLEAGFKLAAQILANRNGPKRIVAITDATMKTAWHNTDAILALKPLAQKKDAITHLVHFCPGVDDGCTELEAAIFDRSPEHPLSAVPHSNHGILLEMEGGVGVDGFLLAAKELVRPTKIEDFEIVTPDESILSEIDYPTVFHEGDAIRHMEISNFNYQYVTLRGKIWSDDFVKIVPVNPTYSGTVVPALLFSSYLYESLSHEQMMRAATAGGAVSPVTSYLSVEPGTRPSTEGFGEEFGMGGLGMIGSGRGGDGYVSGTIGGRHQTTPNYRQLLTEMANTATAECFSQFPDVTHLHTWFETTETEIVDLRVTSPDAAQKCFEDALWNITLPSAFATLHRFSTEINLPL